MTGRNRDPALVVFSSLFPHPGRPGSGLFIRERMFRVAQTLPVVVIAPQPWFPGQSLLRRFRPNFRPPAPQQEKQQGITVYHPRFISVPGQLKWLDGWSMARSARSLIRRLRSAGRADVIDAHFAYPDGYAAVLLGRRFRLPVCITLRGTEPRIATYPLCGRLQRWAMRRAQRILAVADSLRQMALREGVPAARTLTVGNGVDTERFHRLDKLGARKAMNLSSDAKVLISVGGLVERKGFHRVIQLLPLLLSQHPDLVYLIVGGPSPEGDWSKRLHEMVAKLGLQRQVRFLGTLAPDELKLPLSAADLFVLATRNEGWANVLLEAMACGLPVVTTDVGGNREVVCNPRLGKIVPFGDDAALADAITQGLTDDWDRDAIVAYANANSWSARVPVLINEFRRLAACMD